MRARSITFLMLAAVAGLLVWNAAAAQQQPPPRPPTQERPGFGPGVMPVEGHVSVEGTVNVGNVVTVSALQIGDWKAAVTSLPPVTISGPDFVQAGARYQVIWATGDGETVTVSAVGRGGWVRVGDKPERWLNLSSARSVTAAN